MFSKPRLSQKEHQKITGSEADEKDRIIAGVQFFVHYIGSTDVAYANGTGSGNTENPVAQVFDKLRREVNGKPQEKMVLTLCSKSLSVIDKACGKLVASFPIDKITFCNTDKFYKKAFVFVARDKPENPFKAFVFTCESKSKAKEASRRCLWLLLSTMNGTKHLWPVVRQTAMKQLPESAHPVKELNEITLFLTKTGIK